MPEPSSSPRRRPGRPRSSERTEGIHIRLTPEERDLYEAAAAREGLPVGTWMRMVARRAAVG